jgi:hypothetical protein
MFENPHGVPPDEIVRMILENDPEVTAQVVFGKYVESSGLVFTGELIQQLFDRRQERILSSTWMDRTVASQAAITFADRGWFNNRFYTGIDLARLNDYTVIFTLDTIRMPARVVYYRRLNRVPWDSIYSEVGKVRQLFGPNILIDSTGMGGDVVLDALESRRFCPVHGVAVLNDSRCLGPDMQPLDCVVDDYLPLSCVEGFSFNPQGHSSGKKQLVDHLRNCLSVGYMASRISGEEFGWLRCPPIPQLEEELGFYTWDDKGLDTDCLFALALAAWHGLEDPVKDALVGSVHGR